MVASDTFSAQHLLERWLQIDSNGNDASSSLYSPNYTYSYDKYSCIREFYFVHLVFCYFVFLSGIACLFTRIFERTLWLHAWFGRIYILSMFWATGSSLLINNTGLPLATLLSFTAVGGGLTIGWIVIWFHRIQLEKKAKERVQQDIAKMQDDNVDLDVLFKQAKLKLRQEMTFSQRFFSLKTLHGVLFFMSWFNISGRMFASNQSGDFTCYTYPVYKPIDTAAGNFAGTNLTLVPENDPNWDRLPWANGVYAWSFAIIGGSAAAAVFVAAVVAYFGARSAQRARQEPAVSDEDHSAEVDDVVATSEEETVP